MALRTGGGGVVVFLIAVASEAPLARGDLPRVRGMTTGTDNGRMLLEPVKTSKIAMA